MSNPLLGGIEAGGTKFVLAVAEDPVRILASHTIPTLSPRETLAQALAWFDAQGPVQSVGIASFGPVELDRSSERWGHIGTTPKRGWSGFDLAGTMARHTGAPVAIQTDVNGAALAEFELGAGRGARSLAYVTVGTGIGGGFVIDGRIVHGAGHPELGHIYPRRSQDDTCFTGHCPFHGDCLEGLASGPAIQARWGQSLSELAPDHPAHGIVAHQLAQMCHTVFASMAVETIVLGGGVMQTPGLLERVVARSRELDAGYLPHGEKRRILAPHLGGASGITGALMLALKALDEGKLA